MTRISEIHGFRGIGRDEFQDRGREVSPISYVPYLSLTTGEMKLQLAAQRAKIMAQFYGNEAPEYKAAYALLENALTQGIHGGIRFMGAIPDVLQNTARLIAQAQYERAPASKSLFARTNPISGIGAIIPAEQRRQDCLKLAKNKPVEVAKCNKAFKIEEIMNKHIEPASHHVLYKSIPDNYTIPARVDTKRLLHQQGVEQMAIIGKITNPQLMYQWMETGILASNAVGGVGPAGSVKSSFYLSPTPEKYFSKYGIQGYHIGIDPTIVAALVALVVKAIQTAAKWLTDLQKVDLSATFLAKGFGTQSFSSEKSDWPGGADNPDVNESNNSLLMLALIAAGAYALS